MSLGKNGKDIAVIEGALHGPRVLSGKRPGESHVATWLLPPSLALSQRLPAGGLTWAHARAACPPAAQRRERSMTCL